VNEYTSILEISKKNLIKNFEFFKKLNDNCHVGVTVKSDAYGLGIKNIIPILFNAGCKNYFVASYNEGVELRKLLKSINIFILNGSENLDYKKFKKLKLIPILNNYNDYKKFQNKKIIYGLHFNTGINRLGINTDNLNKFNFKDKYLKIVISHLASADERKNLFNEKQLNRFINLKNKINNHKLIFSLSNSFGSILSNKFTLNMIRPGIAIYGSHYNILKLKKNISPVIKLKAKILQIKEINKNEFIGYNQTYQTKKKIWVAIIGIGYGDGLKRILSNTGCVYLNNKKFNILGRVSMDSIVIDIKKEKSKFIIGKFVDVINYKYGVDKIATECKTISHEILTSINKRVGRKIV
tara:strand:- start:3050 stop:4108 length:1059 start_codon:yes stop_codon:yes gene_type:complete